MADTNGEFGESDAPDVCLECGDMWAAGERVQTGDDKGIGGWEDWMYCAACRQEWFFPVVRQATQAQGGGK